MWSFGRNIACERKLPWKTCTLLVFGLAVVLCGCSPKAQSARALERGKHYLETKDYSRAILELQNAARLTPLEAEPYYQLGLAYLEIESPQLALVAFKRAEENNPKFWQAELRIAELLSGSSQLEMVRNAQREAQDVLGQIGESADVLNVLAATEWRLGKKEDAEKHLHEAFARFPADWNAAISLSKIKLARNEWKDAEEVLKTAVQREPGSANLAVALGEFYLSFARDREGRKELEQSLHINPNNVTALFDLAALDVQEARTADADSLYRRISLLPQPRYRPLHALFLLQSGKMDAGLEELRQLHHEDPTNRDIRSHLVSTLVEAGKTAEAEKLLKAVLSNNPADTDALFQISVFYMQQRDYQGAMDNLMEVVRVRPDLAEAHYLLALVYRAKGAILSQKPELEDAVRLSPSFLAARIELSQYLLNTRAYVGALDIMDRAPAGQKQSVAYIEQRNWGLLALGRNDEVYSEVVRGLGLQRTETLLLQKAILDIQQNRAAAARTEILEALGSAPEDLRALNLLMASYRVSKETARGIEELKSFAAEHLSAAAVQRFLGDVLIANNDRAGALRAYEAARSANPRFKAVDLAIARMYIEDGRPEDARELVATVLQSDARNSGANFLMGWFDDGAGHYKEALQEYRRAVEADPSNIQALNNLAFLLSTRFGNEVEGLKYAQKAKELSPNDAEISDTLGWIYYQEGLYASAIPYLEQSVSRNSTAQHSFHLAMAYWKAGRREQAQTTLAMARKNNSKIPEAEEAQRVFARQ